jgi:phenylacetate-CoA ligase
LTKILGRTGEAVRVRGMFVHPKQTDEVIARFPDIRRYQLVVTRPENRDEMVLKVELAVKHAEAFSLGTMKGEIHMPVESEKLKNELDKAFRDVCKVRFDKFELVGSGSIAENAKHIIDKRKY